MWSYLFYQERFRDNLGQSSVRETDRYHRHQNFIQQFWKCLPVWLHVVCSMDRFPPLQVWYRRACHSSLWCLFCLSRPRYLNVAIVRSSLSSVFDVGGEEYQVIEAGHQGWQVVLIVGGDLALIVTRAPLYHQRITNTRITPNTNMQLTKCNGN